MLKRRHGAVESGSTMKQKTVTMAIHEMPQRMRSSAGIARNKACSFLGNAASCNF